MKKKIRGFHFAMMDGNVEYVHVKKLSLALHIHTQRDATLVLYLPT